MRWNLQVEKFFEFNFFFSTTILHTSLFLSLFIFRSLNFAHLPLFIRLESRERKNGPAQFLSFFFFIKPFISAVIHDEEIFRQTTLRKHNYLMPPHYHTQNFSLFFEYYSWLLLHDSFNRKRRTDEKFIKTLKEIES